MDEITPGQTPDLVRMLGIDDLAAKIGVEVDAFESDLISVGVVSEQHAHQHKIGNIILTTVGKLSIWLEEKAAKGEITSEAYECFSKAIPDLEKLSELNAWGIKEFPFGTRVGTKVVVERLVREIFKNLSQTS